MGVNASLEQKDGSRDSEDMNGAGDQGMMFGYACDETEEYMPLPISLAHKLAMRLTQARKESIIEDGKTQVTVAFDEDMNALYIDTVVISVQHLSEKDLGVLRDEIIEKVITPIIPSVLMHNDTNIYVNPTGRFVVGGPKGDSGLTGRKIIVDTYGGFARDGGGAFSGKDPSKVNRSGAYWQDTLLKILLPQDWLNVAKFK